ncbi:putative bifunctional diguanylate cyclase/phosphodiesterase [Sphingomonas panni]
MRRADLALNEAKRSGRGVVRLFDDSMDESIRFRRRIEEGLTQAIANHELALLYQPIVAHDTLAIVGFEGLLRWNSPDHGAIGPATFMPIAEESNLIHDLGDWVLDTALACLAEWPGHYVSVNFSPRQFRRQNFVGHLVEKVQRAGVSPDRLQIEITETAIFDDAERAADTLYRLRQMGFRIALDDFGTGYSSLYNIRKFALDCLKIDRSFIDGMGRERESAAIVHSIIHLARALRLQVIAEGWKPNSSCRRCDWPVVRMSRAIICRALSTARRRRRWRATGRCRGPRNRRSIPPDHDRAGRLAAGCRAGAATGTGRGIGIAAAGLSLALLVTRHAALWGVATGAVLLVLLLATVRRGIACWVTDPLRLVGQEMATLFEPGRAPPDELSAAPAEIRSLSRRLALVRRQVEEQAGRRELHSFRLGRAESRAALVHNTRNALSPISAILSHGLAQPPIAERETIERVIAELASGDVPPARRGSWPPIC